MNMIVIETGVMAKKVFGEIEERSMIACVRRRSMSPAHATALYPSIASGDAIIRRV